MLRTTLENWEEVEVYKKKKVNLICEELTKLIQKITDEIVKQYKLKQSKNSKFPDNLQTLIFKRNFLINKKYKSPYDTMEFQIIAKLTKQRLREYNKKKETEIINDILNSSKSITEIKRNLLLGKQWMIFLLDQDTPIYTRKGINELAKKFYSKLYEKEKLRPQNRLPEGTEANENNAPTQS